MKFCIVFLILGIQAVAEVVRIRRLRWFGHMERKSGEN